MYQFDWIGIDEKFKWFAVDANGKACVYIDKPIKYGRDWFSDGYKIVDQFGNIIDWENSLQERPPKEVTTKLNDSLLLQTDGTTKLQCLAQTICKLYEMEGLSPTALKALKKMAQEALKE